MSTEIPIVSRTNCGLVPVSDIIYINCNYRKSEIHTKSKDITVYYPRSQVEAYLDQRFSYCLKGLIVNFDEVTNIDEGVICFRNGEEIRLGKTNYVKARQNFAAYIKKRKKPLANVNVL